MTSKGLPGDSVCYDPQDLKQNMSELQRKEYLCTTKAQELRVLARVQRRSTLTVEETAEVLGLSRAFAYEAVNRGEIPSIRIGRRILVPKVALERLLNSADGQQLQ